MLIARSSTLIIFSAIAFQNCKAHMHHDEVHMAPPEEINTNESISKDKKTLGELAFMRRQEFDKQKYEDFLKEE